MQRERGRMEWVGERERDVVVAVVKSNQKKTENQIVISEHESDSYSDRSL